MGLNQSLQLGHQEQDEDDEEDDGEGVNGRRSQPEVKKVLQQEPEMLPCYASVSPLSPQLSSLGTPLLEPSIKVWDPYNVLAPPPELPSHHFSVNYSFGSPEDDRSIPPMTEVYLISHGESEMSLRPEVISGRCPSSRLTGKGRRQARALAVFLGSHGVRFNAVYTSPLDRARDTAISVCKEMNFGEQQIQISDSLTEMSQGHWEGCLHSDIYTHEMLDFIDKLQPDSSAPCGESLRQVEFRMSQFLKETLPSPFHQNGVQHWDWVNRHKHQQRKKSGKSRLQAVTTNGDIYHYPQDETHTFCVGVFTHSVPIKCILTGIVGCSPVMSHKICIDESSVTVLQYSYKTGWQVKRLNDTAHLRLL